MAAGMSCRSADLYADAPAWKRHRIGDVAGVTRSATTPDDETASLHGLWIIEPRPRCAQKYGAFN